MSVIAKAIAARQSEIERLQAEIKAFNDVDKILGTSAPAKPAGRSSSRRPAAAATPVAETASDATPARKRRPMTAEEEGGGVRADESLLGRAQKESREVARCPAAGGSPDKPPHLRGRCAFLTAKIGAVKQNPAYQTHGGVPPREPSSSRK